VLQTFVTFIHDVNMCLSCLFLRFVYVSYHIYSCMQRIFCTETRVQMRVIKNHGIAVVQQISFIIWYQTPYTIEKTDACKKRKHDENDDDDEDDGDKKKKIVDNKH